MPLTIRERARRYYEAHAPDKVGNIDKILKQYAGREEELMADLVKKYNAPEPSDPVDLDEMEEAAATMTPQSSRIAIRNASPMTVSTSSPLMQDTMRMLASGQQPQQQQMTLGVASPQTQGNPSYGDFPASSEFGDDASDASPSNTDPYSHLKRRRVVLNGFPNEELKRTWDDAWLGKIPLGNYRKLWGDNALHEGFGMKLTNNPKLRVPRWQKRYFVLVPNFLYYFDTDDAMTPCKGAVYLARCTISVSTVREKPAIVITQPDGMVLKPLELASQGDFSTFSMHFDPKNVQTTWREMLEEVVKLATSSSSSSSLRRPSATLSPTPLARASGSPAASFRMPTPQPQSHQPQLLQTTSNESSRQQPDLTVSPLTPAADVPAASLPSRPALSTAGEDSLNRSGHREQLFLQQAATTQQQLQALLLAQHQQQQDNLYRQQLQQEAGRIRQSLHIDDTDLKKRIVKIAADKDARELAETLLHFTVETVTDLNALWKLMSDIDDLESVNNMGNASTSFAAGTVGSAQHASLRQENAALLAQVQQLQHQLAEQQQQHLSSVAALRQQINLQSQSMSYNSEFPNDERVGGGDSGEHALQQQLSTFNTAQRSQRMQWNQATIAQYGNTFASVPQTTSAAYRSDTPPPASPPHAASPHAVYGGSGVLSPSSASVFYSNSNGAFTAAVAAPAPPYLASNAIDDPRWQDRMLLLQQRKRAAESILNDLPARY